MLLHTRCKEPRQEHLCFCCEGLGITCLYQLPSHAGIPDIPLSEAHPLGACRADTRSTMLELYESLASQTRASLRGLAPWTLRTWSCAHPQTLIVTLILPLGVLALAYCRSLWFPSARSAESAPHSGAAGYSPSPESDLHLADHHMCMCRAWHIISHPLATNPFPASFLNCKASFRIAPVLIPGNQSFMDWRVDLLTELHAVDTMRTIMESIMRVGLLSEYHSRLRQPCIAIALGKLSRCCCGAPLTTPEHLTLFLESS